MYDIVSELISEHERRAQDIIEGAERSQAILAQMRELAELNPQVKREIDVCSSPRPGSFSSEWQQRQVPLPASSGLQSNQ